ncbi:phage holin [Virgibacillus sp. CBA3643]
MVALVNQILVLFDKSPLPFDSVFVEQLLSVLFTIVASLVAWFKNNYVTKKGHRQKEALLEKGLTGEKE